jgi:uncharacterized coiled-coil protein SlyX
MHEAEQLAQLADRLVRLETVVTHLEQTIQTLDQVVIAQARQLDAARGKIEALTQQLGQIRESAQENRKPEEEIPPHY